MEREKLNELFFQALETEKGGVQVYEIALRCAVNDELKEEWSKYLEQTQRHVRIVTDLFGKFGLDTERKSPGAEIVHLKGESLVNAMTKALENGDRSAAQLVAAECVIDAENKDHMNWELLREAVKELQGEESSALKDACEQVEEEEDQHLYHTMGWCRELWIEFLGLPAVLPPPEETKNVDTAEEAARARRQRSRMPHRGGGTRRGRRAVKSAKT